MMNSAKLTLIGVVLLLGGYRSAHCVEVKHHSESFSVISFTLSTIVTNDCGSDAIFVNVSMKNESEPSVEANNV